MALALKAGLALLAALVVFGLVAVAVGSRSWRQSTERLDVALTSGSAPFEPIVGSELPEPVARYRSRAMAADGRRVTTVRLEQAGFFQMGEGEEGWRPFTATEVMRLAEPGFFWDAAIELAPALDVRIRDSYVDGVAGMVGKVLGVVTVVDAPDEAALREGALSRYLAESVWLPPRLVAGPGLRWSPIDPHRAEATLEDRGTSVTLRFTFDASGDPIEVFGIRAREQDGEYIQTPWIGRFREHRDVGGFRIPMYGEVAWVIEGDEQLYWRGTITAVDFR